MIIALAGVSGSGKTTTAHLLERVGYRKIVTYTSRKPRPGEVDGVDYHFCDRSSMLAWKNIGAIWEIEEYFGHLYGSPQADMARNYVTVLQAEGITKYKNWYKECCFAVLLTASDDEIKRRLDERDKGADTYAIRGGERGPSSELFDYVLDTTGKTPEHVAFEIQSAMFNA